MSRNAGNFYDVLPDGRFVMQRAMDPTRLRELVLVQNLGWPQAPARE